MLLANLIILFFVLTNLVSLMPVLLICVVFPILPTL